MSRVARSSTWRCAGSGCWCAARPCAPRWRNNRCCSRAPLAVADRVHAGARWIVRHRDWVVGGVVVVLVMRPRRAWRLLRFGWWVWRSARRAQAWLSAAGLHGPGRRAAPAGSESILKREENGMGKTVEFQRPDGQGVQGYLAEPAAAGRCAGPGGDPGVVGPERPDPRRGRPLRRGRLRGAGARPVPRQVDRRGGRGRAPDDGPEFRRRRRAGRARRRAAT